MAAPRNPFVTTHWSVVLKAAGDDSPEAAAALEQLCADYWYPLYAFLRRRGHPPDEAEDLTQTFFAERVVTRRILRDVNPSAGRFRSWLLTCLQNRVATEREHRHAQRRGGAIPHLALGSGEAESFYAQEPSKPAAPEHLYDRAWAITVLRRTLAMVEARYDAAGQRETFQRLRTCLPGVGNAPDYAVLARECGKSIDAIKMSVSRLRQAFRQELRAELLRTVSSPEEVDEELGYLRTILASLS